MSQSVSAEGLPDKNGDRAKPGRTPAGQTIARSQEQGSVRRLALYVGLIVLVCQLVFVHTFLPSFDHAVLQLNGSGGPASSVAPVRSAPLDSRYSRPDILQWSGAQSLVWIASLFAPQTPVRLAPALVFFLVAGGFLAATYRPARSGSLVQTVMGAATEGMKLWLSWFAAAVILLVYIVTSSGGIEALRVSAGITFEKSWRDIVDAFLSHWLIYIAWFVFLGFLPMVGGGILGLIRTQFLTKLVHTKRVASQEVCDNGRQES